jgi:uncharacterized protein YdbL (DUF1318 family)
MQRWISASLSLALLAASACVTINVYFPAAAAEKAADRIIDDVWGTQKNDSKSAPQSRAAALLIAALEFVVPAAQAAEPNIDISSPEIQKLTASMEARHASLLPHFASGAIGLTADGLVTPRDPNTIPLADRNKVRGLVADENADRQALYRELAKANGQPAWEADIRKVFAQRWIARAPAGWWYQDASGAWKQK